MEGTKAWVHRVPDYVATGYTDTGERRPDVPHYLFAILGKELDYKASDIVAIRIEANPDKWAILIKPGAVKGFVSEPILP